jgi:ribosome-binding factor A
MDTKKQLQVAEVIRRNMSMVLQDEGGYIYGVAPLVTVTEVKMTPDFSIAKVYFSVFNIEDKQTPIIAMEANNARLRHALAKRIKSAVRRIPEIQFYLDDTLDEMYRVDALFEKLYEEDQMGKEEGPEDL